ncbi:MAG: FtsH protease activity modulator HflK [Desulfovibrionaceae bacterium]
MNWDWDKLQEKRKGMPFSSPSGPQFDNVSDLMQRFRNSRFPGGKAVILLVVLVWLASGIYIIKPDEVGVVLRFGAFDRITEAGPHYHFPFPLERVEIPKVTQIRRIEVGLRSLGHESNFQQGQFRIVPEESLMLTGDENIVDVQFIVQYQIKDPVQYLFSVKDQAETVKKAAEAAMREVIGYNKIDSALTTGKNEIQNQARQLMQDILDRYNAGLRVVAVQLQDVQPPKEVVDAFKDVASAREDRSRFINEAEAYQNDLLPKTRGLAARYVNEAEAYKESVVRRATGEASRFLAVLKEYNKAKDVTRERLYIETMEALLANPNMEKVLLSGDVNKKVVPYLPLETLRKPQDQAPEPGTIQEQLDMKRGRK